MKKATRFSVRTVFLAMWCLCLLLLCSCFGLGPGGWGTSGGGGAKAGKKPKSSGLEYRDVRGNYMLTYDNQIRLKLNIGGAIREAVAGTYGEIVDFGVYKGKPLKLDLSEFCARKDVQCPSEVLWDEISINQKDVHRAQGAHILQVIDNREKNLPPGKRASSVGGWVDHNKRTRFLVGLGVRGGGQGKCGALAVSVADGRFTFAGESWEEIQEYRDAKGKPCKPETGGQGSEPAPGEPGGQEPPEPKPEPSTCKLVTRQKRVIPKETHVDGIAEGRVRMAWLGGCAFGPVLLGATLEIETGFEARRVGDFQPPPYTPKPPTKVEGDDEPSTSSPAPREPETTSPTEPTEPSEPGEPTEPKDP